MTAFRPPPARHWRSYGTEPLPQAAEALDLPLATFPSWFLPSAARVGQCGCLLCQPERLHPLPANRIQHKLRGLAHPWCHLHHLNACLWCPVLYLEGRVNLLISGSSPIFGLGRKPGGNRSLRVIEHVGV